MTPRTADPACRAFEDLLESRLASGVPSEKELPHLESCAACRLLHRIVAANEQLALNLSRPKPSTEFLRLLMGIPERTEPVWKQSREILALLRPGTLEAPALPESLSARLNGIPAEKRRLAPVIPIATHTTRSPRPKWFRDWRVAVAGMYAATILIATFLRWDPMTVARRTASDLTVTGERAVAEARDRATERLADSLRVSRTRPLREQLDYRLYRAMVVSKAKAGAYAGFVVEKLLGQKRETERSAQNDGETRMRTSSEVLEPPSPHFRS